MAAKVWAGLAGCLGGAKASPSTIETSFDTPPPLKENSQPADTPGKLSSRYSARGSMESPKPHLQSLPHRRSPSPSPDTSTPLLSSGAMHIHPQMLKINPASFIFEKIIRSGFSSARVCIRILSASWRCHVRCQRNGPRPGLFVSVAIDLNYSQVLSVYSRAARRTH